MTLNALTISVLALTLSTTLFAQDTDLNKDYLTISHVTVTEVKKDLLNQEVSELVSDTLMTSEATSSTSGLSFIPLDKIGQALMVAPGIVALGEGVYNLVQKGKPMNKTNYAPISVLPTIGKEAVEIFDTENWRQPKKYTYEMSFKNLYDMEVVQFRYTVIYAYGGGYNGTGAYITAAQIIPERVRTLFGFSFSANMKLSGVQNHGTRANPVAGALLTMEYQTESVLSADMHTSTFHLTGRGGFKKL